MPATQPYDFDELAVGRAASGVAYSADDVEVARAAGREEAIAQAIDAEAAEQTRLLSLITERLGDAARDHDRALAGHLETLTRTARDIVTEVCKSAGAADEGAAALDILERYLKAAPEETPAKLILSSHALEDAIAKLEKAIRDAGAGALVTIMHDDALAPGDARIEWRGGAMSRTESDVVAQIETLFDRVAPATQMEKRP